MPLQRLAQAASKVTVGMDSPCLSGGLTRKMGTHRTHKTHMKAAQEECTPCRGTDGGQAKILGVRGRDCVAETPKDLPNELLPGKHFWQALTVSTHALKRRH
jgi:hypothetical protein